MKNTAKELRQLGDSELSKKLEEIEKELIKARSQISSGSSKNPKQASVMKRTIARIKTIQTEIHRDKKVSGIVGVENSSTQKQKASSAQKSKTSSENRKAK